MAPLLVHSEHVPAVARDALKAAFDAEPDQRERLLESAARILWRETQIECTDVRELIGLND